MKQLSLTDVKKARKRGGFVGLLSTGLALVGLAAMFRFATSLFVLIPVGIITACAIYFAWLTLVKGAELLAEIERNMKESDQDCA